MTGKQFTLAFPQPLLPLDSLFADDVQGEASLRILRRWREWPKPYLGLTGQPRSGVTTLLRSWADDVGGKYLRPEDWQSLDAQDISVLLAQPLAIDDADLVKSPEALLTLMNLAGEQTTALLLGGHSATHLWHTHPPDLVSRLSAMTSIQLSNLADDEIFRKRLRQACLRRHIKIPNETLAFVEPRLERSYQAIEAFAHELDAGMSETGRPPTIPLARDILNRFLDASDCGEP
ncbi:MAG: hypothetical protein CMK07_03380 [Ponticaulis sp.]|nr:hypothetical protein [Ponticaulis sp.]